MTLHHRPACEATDGPMALGGARPLFSNGRKLQWNRQQSEGAERSSEWYDHAFDRSEHFCRHYSRSRYYFLWTVIADRLTRHGAMSVLDVGCGAGQLACLLRDRGLGRYCGFDFSPKRIEQARKVCPEYDFHVADAFRTELFQTCEYDTVLCTEFLEHVEGDLEVLRRIRPGAVVHGTVPNFPYMAHVRHFESAGQVRERYEPILADLSVDALAADGQGRTFFLIEGRTH